MIKVFPIAQVNGVGQDDAQQNSIPSRSEIRMSDYY
jgi:hypothetical protein